jgi:hypothetical protein
MNELEKTESQQLVALSASDMPVVQESILEWCDLQIRNTKPELRDAKENFVNAQKHKWKSSPFKNLVRKFERRIEYYEKVKVAVKEGYVIVPNFPVDIFAIRTKAKTPRYDQSQSYWHDFLQNSQSLPQDEGEYKNAAPKVEVIKKDDKRIYYPEEFKPDIAFPVTAVKPLVLEATQKAMALKLFDEIGIVRQSSGRDPIVCGIIKNPSRAFHQLTFFIAWFINYRDI